MSEETPEDHDCAVCGATAYVKCANCGEWLCADCIRNPCDDDHYDY